MRHLIGEGLRRIRNAGRVGALAALIVLVLLLIPSAMAQADDGPAGWSQMAPQGFGDRQNSTAWSMIWWRGRLYVGTMRSFVCWRGAGFATALPARAADFYPPKQPSADCTASTADLPMRAEIWRWTPEIDRWDMVYRSPQDVPIPGAPGKLTARDIGYRGMIVFQEGDGTEALYITGITARGMYPDSESLPPPRLLRTTDGETFTPVPQQPGTFLGDLPLTGLRTGSVYRGRLLLTHGTARGQGVLIESDNPSAGNDAFRVVGPAGLAVWDAVPFAGQLYVGTSDEKGFRVLRTEATGSPPYTYEEVIEIGGGLREKPSSSVVSMEEYQGDLYVGTFKPAELYRIHSDGSWDLIMGQERVTLYGLKTPLSGMGPGFDFRYNVQIYRMEVSNGVLYLGTLDTGKDYAEMSPGGILDVLLAHTFGFDLYKTTDGTTFAPVTTTGFGDPYQVSVRTFANTPYGLVMGTGSYWYGLRLWRLSMPVNARVHLPMILR